jgi:uncharacterized membrane protein
MNRWKLVVFWLTIYAVAESTWLTLTKDALYLPMFRDVSGDADANLSRLWSVPIAYVSIGWAWWLLVLRPALTTKDTIAAVARAASFAFAIYGVYNVTNMVSFSRWDVSTSVIDMSWGVFAITVVTWIVMIVNNRS